MVSIEMRKTKFKYSTKGFELSIIYDVIIIGSIHEPEFT